jgi:hypothetical protein
MVGLALGSFGAIGFEGVPELIKGCVFLILMIGKPLEVLQLLVDILRGATRLHRIKTLL